MDNLTLDRTFTAKKFLSLHHSRISTTLCIPRKPKKVVFACKDETSSSLTSGFLSRTHFSNRKSKKVVVFASKDDKKLDYWDKMELRFATIIGEDPQLTLDKIKRRKAHPGMTDLEIEKIFGKKKSGEIVEIPFDVPKKNNPPNSSDGLNLVRPVPKNSSDGLNLVCPVPKNSSNGLNLVRPVPKRGVKFEVDDKPLETKGSRQSQPIPKPAVSKKSSVPNVILRKPASYYEEDESSNIKIRPNLTLKMRKELKVEKFSDVTLLKKPEPMSFNLESDEKNEQSSDVLPVGSDDISDVTLLKKPDPVRINSEKTEQNEQSSDILPVASDDTSDVRLSEKPEPMRINSGNNEENEQSSDAVPVASVDIADANMTKGYASTSESRISLFPNKPEPRNLNLKSDLNQEASGDQPSSVLPESSLNAANSSSEHISMTENMADQPLQPSRSNHLEEQGSGTGFQHTDSLPAERSSDSDSPSGTGSMEYLDAALIGKPKRLDQPKKATLSVRQEVMPPVNSEVYGNASEIDNILEKLPIKEHEDNDWARAEKLVKNEGRAEVELISCSTRGFVVSFGSLIGFLPYRYLSSRWKFAAFESWLRYKGLDPSLYKQGLGIIGSYYGFGKAASPEAGVDPQIAHDVEEEVTPDMKLEDLLRIYDQEKLKFLSSSVGQKVRVSVVLADRNSRKLILSIKEKEKEELVKKKRNLMAKLQVGDVVKCCIQKITYFGVFVEVEGVAALIHQTEVSWDDTLDPLSLFKIGQIVEAKVHQLDFSQERIFLSLKEVMPDPMMEALEAVVGDHDCLNGKLEAAEQDTEWPEVEALINELQQFEGISSVSQGRYFLSPGLAPTFQVYMASMLENQYKLLARSGNRVQEVIVETTLGKEEMKSAIQSCTNKVQ